MSTLRETLVNREQEPISFRQIMRVVKNHASPNFVLVDDLKELPTDKDIFGSRSCACILLTKWIHGQRTTVHHWVCLIKRKGRYEYFDPLGFSIKQMVMQLHSNKKSLENWASNRRVEESRIKLQQNQADVNTCGLHVAVRLCHEEMSNRQYARWLQHAFLKPDLSVSALCYLDLLKGKVPPPGPRSR